MSDAGTVRAYLRISKRTDESQSIEQQRRKAGRWADYHRPNAPIEWYVDEGVSASKAVRRPERERVLADLRHGDVLLAMKVDRLARSVADLLSIVERAKDRGAAVAFTDQDISTEGAYGQFTVTLLGALAELEAGIIRERVVAAYETFDREGRHGYGRVPPGFISVVDEEKGWKVIRPDPQTGPLIRAAILEIIGGVSISQKARDLGMPFNTLRKLMVNQRLIGRQPGGKLDPDAALISASEWRDLQGRLRGTKAWSRAPGYGAALECYECGGRLYLNVTSKPTHGGQYVCAGRHPKKANVLRDVGDQFVERWFLKHHGSDPHIEAIVVTDDDERMNRSAELEIDMDDVLGRLRDARGEAREVLVAELGRLQDEHDAIENSGPVVRTEIVDSGKTVAEQWALAGDDERTEMVLSVASFKVHPASAPKRITVIRRQPSAAP